VIDLRGQLVPVFDLRHRFGLPMRAVEPDDHLIIARTATRVAALQVDRVLHLADVDPTAIADPRDHLAGDPRVAGVAMLADGLALITDVDTFLSRAEVESLEAALNEMAQPVAPKNWHSS
jgi:purine-binding chemotaxis protein CheW